MTPTDDVLDDRNAFEAFARVFARSLRPGDVVALEGPLGAGKTTFVRGVVAALHGSDAAVSSPTFVFRQRYDAPSVGPPAIEHVDLYRIEDPAAELPELALDDAFGSDSIALVEWAERASGWLPAGSIRVTIAGIGDGPRTVRISRPA